ncbi:LLM class flavin-dependent oxidoreductase [Candidatus Bathyarchaeota archaeon]|nr:LLM class flavin-dependent oxidoreductase [Candidatus Bathyarchaeota archaeon]
MINTRQIFLNNHERIGVYVGNYPINEIIRKAKLAEEMGFESIWNAEHYGELRDPFITLAALASATNRIKLATGVVGPYTRHPAIHAFALGTLDELSQGRMIFGIGAGNLTRMKDRLCIEGKKPLTYIKETVEIVRHLLVGKPVSYQGKVFSVSELSLGFSPIRTNIPIYIGATGDQMLKLTARIADGVLFSSITSPNYVKYAIKVMREETNKIERDFDEIDIACNILCCLSEDSKLAHQTVKPAILSFLARPVRGELIMEKAGLDAELLIPIRKALQSGDREEALKLVNDRMIDNLSIAGTPDECIKKLKKWRSAGVKLLIIETKDNYEETIKVFAP